MDLARKNWVAQAEQRKIAAAAKREAVIYAREIGNVRVTIDDSRRAGNCLEGTLTWCEQKLGISRQEILDGGYLFSQPAAKVLAINGHQGVQRAVKFAWLRETLVSI